MTKPVGTGGSGRVTIREVAEDAGVSVAAVSKVLRDAYGVSDAMQKRVKQSMAKLGYRPHAAARGMRGQTFTIGLILPDLRNPFFADIYAGINSALERTQYQVLLGVSNTGGDVDHAMVDAMLDRQMDGLLMIGAVSHEQLLAVATRKPLATIGHHAPASGIYDTVNNDDLAGASLAVKHLTANGYRRITMLSLTSDSSIITQRELGYRKAMMEEDLGAHLNVVRSGQTLREVQGAARRLLEGPNRPEAVFCWTDFIALEVISVAREMGLSQPDDLAVVGYDNTVFCELTQNSLTSVDQSGELLGLQSARLLIERIQGRTEAEHYVVQPRVVARRSSAMRSAARA